jgi:excisionase family DNA binding protein
MSKSDNQSSGQSRHAHRRDRVLQPGILPLARMVASLFDFAERESPVLFERLGGKDRRACGDLGGLIAGLGKAIKDPAPEIRVAAVRTLGRLGQVFETYSGDVAAAAAAAVTALSAALTDADAGVREAALDGLGSFPTAASAALVDRVSRAAEDPDPRVRRASLAVLRVFGPKAALPVVAALLRVIVAPGAQNEELVQMAIEGLVDCGQDAASEAVDTLAVVVRDSRMTAGIRVAACKVLAWLGPEAESAGVPLADVLLAIGERSVPTDVRAAAAQALLQVADLPELVAPRATHDDQRQELLSVLRQAGAEATVARRAIQATWKGVQAAPSEHSAPAAGQPETTTPDATAARLASLESTLTRIARRLEATQAASPDKHAYTVAEVAELTKLGEWTVRNACNKGRIKADKSPDGLWRIPRDELVKIQNEGLPK